MPAVDYVVMPVAELDRCRADWNPRTISSDDSESLRRSIESFGLVQPLVFNRTTKTLIGGHQRLSALVAAGAADALVAVVELDPVDERLLGLAMNRISGDWNWSKLSAVLQSLAARSPALARLSGFSDVELDRLAKDGHLLMARIEAGRSALRARPAAAPAGPSLDECEPPAAGAVVSRLGDLWTLGDHRLICGSSEDPAVLSRLLPAGVKASLLATDPPYGVSYVETKRGMAGFAFADSTVPVIANDDLTGDRLRDFLARVLTACRPHLIAGAPVFLWHAGMTACLPVLAAAEQVGLRILRQIVWSKPGLILSRSGMYHWSHEPCFFGAFGKPRSVREIPPEAASSVWFIGHDSERVGHPTQKPAALFLRQIVNHTLPREAVLEPFSGSGSQLIAAARAGRSCCAVELEPRYVDVAVRRWQRFAGGVAVLDGTKLTFEQVAADRAARPSPRSPAALKKAR